MRPLAILITAQAALFVLGAAIVPSYAASPPDDGVTIVQSAPAAPAAPAAPTTMTVMVGDGDTITAVAGSMIVVQMDPKTGDYHSSVAAAQGAAQ